MHDHNERERCRRVNLSGTQLQQRPTGSNESDCHGLLGVDPEPDPDELSRLDVEPSAAALATG